MENYIFWSEIRVRIWGTGRHSPTKNSQEYPPGGSAYIQLRDKRKFSFSLTNEIDHSPKFSVLLRIKLTQAHLSHHRVPIRRLMSTEIFWANNFFSGVRRSAEGCIGAGQADTSSVEGRSHERLSTIGDKMS